MKEDKKMLVAHDAGENPQRPGRQQLRFRWLAGAYAIVRMDPSRLRACGLSSKKSTHLVDLAEHFLDGSLQTAHWSDHDDEQLIAELTRVSMNIATQTYRPLEAYVGGGLFYLAINLCLATLGAVAERRLARAGAR